MAVAVSIDPAEVPTAPGVPVDVVVSVRNDSSIVEEYTLRADGPGGAYITLEPPSLSIYPGRTATAVARILVPRSPAVVAGELAAAIQVAPTALMTVEIDELTRTTVGEVVELILIIQPFSSVTAELVPPVSRSRGRKRVRLAIDNYGNTGLRASVVGGFSERLVVVSRTPDIFVDPGRVQFASISLVPRRRIWRGQPAAHPYTVTLTPDVGEAVSVDGTHVQEPVFPPWFWRALIALAALIALLVLLWNLLVKPTVQEAARDAVAAPIAEVQERAASAEQAAQGAEQSAAAAQQAAESGGDESPTPGPQPPQSTTTNRAFVLAVTAAPGARAEQGMPEPVGDGAVFRVTDLVFNNPQGDAGTIVLGYADTVLLTLSTENYRDLDLHFVSPIEVPAGATLEARLDCRAAGTLTGRPTPDRCQSSVLVTGSLLSPPVG